MNALPFDKDFNKKAAYKRLRNGMKNFDRNHPAVIERNKRRATEQDDKLDLSAEPEDEDDQQFELEDPEDSSDNLFVY